MGGFPIADVEHGLEEGQSLQLGDLEAFAAADVAAGDHVVAADHVGLSLGESGAVAFVGTAWQLRPFAPDHPIDDVVAGLAAVRADKGVGLLLIGFGKKIAFFHNQLNSQLSSRRKVFHTQGAMTKRKKEKFSVTKAVKSNARDVVGQPKASRVVDDRPKPEGRESKHKPSLEKLIEGQESEE